MHLPLGFDGRIRNPARSQDLDRHDGCPIRVLRRDLAVMADNTGAGPINDNTGAVPIGLYHLPFRLMVDCPKCP